MEPEDPSRRHLVTALGVAAASAALLSRPAQAAPGDVRVTGSFLATGPAMLAGPGPVFIHDAATDGGLVATGPSLLGAVGSVAELRAFDFRPPAGLVMPRGGAPGVDDLVGCYMRVLGHSYAGDGGGGVFFLDLAGGDVDDDGTVIAVAASPELVWRRVIEGPINVRWFGAVGDGVADDTAALQAALDLATSGAAPTTVWLPAGRYRVTQTLEIINQAVNDARAAGPLLQGDGDNATFLLGFLSSGPLLRARGVATTTVGSTSFFWGGGLERLTLSGGGRPGADLHALEVIGWGYASLRQARISGFGGDAIRQVSDTTVNPNPDFTASISWRVEQVWIERNDGYGFHNTGLQGAPGWAFSQVVFVLCRAGGAYVQSSSVSFVGCSFSAAGWNPETPAGRNPAGAYGLFYGGNAATANSRMLVQACEFDTSLTAHIGGTRLTVSHFLTNRFIHNDRYGTGYLTPPVAVAIAPTSANDVWDTVRFIDSFVRIDTPGEMTAFDWVNVANVQNIVIKGTTLTNLPGATVTRFRGYTASRMHLRQHYVIDDRRVGGNLVSPGRPAPSYMGAMSAGALPGVATPLIFDRQNGVNQQIFGSAFYDVATGRFRAPATGYYDVDVAFTVLSLANGELVTLQVRVGGAGVADHYVWGYGAPRTPVQTRARVYADEGQDIEVVATNLAQRSVDGLSFNRLVIALV